MKIIFFNHFISSGGAERVTSLISKQFVEDGHDVSLVTDVFYPFTYQFDDRIKVLPLFDRNNQRQSRWSLFLMIKRCRKYIKKEHADILIAVLPLMTFTVYLASLGLKQRLIASDHTSIDRPVGWHIRFIKKYIYPRASVVTLLTETDAKILGDRLPNKVVIPNPLSFPVVSTDFPPKEKTILAAGRLDVWDVKGFDILIAAWGLIAQKYPDWKLRIAGAGQEESKRLLYQMAGDHHVHEQFELLGFKKDLDAEMRKSSIFVLSSRVEGFGMVLIEAMSQGCACVSFDDGGRQREIIRNDEEGFIIEDRKPEVLASKIELLIKDENLRNKVSLAAVKRASDYNLCLVAKKWEDLFGRL